MVDKRPVVLAFVLLGCLGGCGSDGNDGMSKEQVRATSQRDSLLTKSGGKWDGLSAEDKQAVMRDYGTSDENEAKRFFERAAQGENLPTRQPGAPNAAPTGQ